MFPVLFRLRVCHPVIQLPRRRWSVLHQPALQDLYPHGCPGLPDPVHNRRTFHAGEMGELQDQPLHSGRGDVTVLRQGLPPGSEYYLLIPTKMSKSFLKCDCSDTRRLQPGRSDQSRQVLWWSSQLQPWGQNLGASRHQGQEQAGHPGASHGHSGRGVLGGSSQTWLQDQISSACLCLGTENLTTSN